MDLLLGGAVIGHARVAIHVIFREVQHHGGDGPQTVSRFQLEAGELQHTKIHRLLEQGQRRGAYVAPHANLEARFGNHLTHEGGDCALAVGAGDGDDGGLGLAHEQLDVADYVHTLLGGSPEFGRRQGDARTCHYQMRLGEQGLIQALNEFNPGRELILTRGIATGIHHQGGHTTAEEIIDTRETGFPQTYDDDHD